MMSASPQQATPGTVSPPAAAGGVLPLPLPAALPVVMAQPQGMSLADSVLSADDQSTSNLHSSQVQLRTQQQPHQLPSPQQHQSQPTYVLSGGPSSLNSSQQQHAGQQQLGGSLSQPQPPPYPSALHPPQQQQQLQPGQPVAAASATNNSRVLSLQNVPLELAYGELEQTVAQFGTLEGDPVYEKDPHSGRPTGVVHVTFTSADAVAPATHHLTTTRFYAQSIRVLRRQAPQQAPPQYPGQTHPQSQSPQPAAASAGASTAGGHSHLRGSRIVLSRSNSLSQSHSQSHGQAAFAPRRAPLPHQHQQQSPPRGPPPAMPQNHQQHHQQQQPTQPAQPPVYYTGGQQQQQQHQQPLQQTTVVYAAPHGGWAAAHPAGPGGVYPQPQFVTVQAPHHNAPQLQQHQQQQPQPAMYQHQQYQQPASVFAMQPQQPQPQPPPQWMASPLPVFAAESSSAGPS